MATAQIQLHILTKPNDDLARETIAERLREAPESVKVVDLTAGEPDYDRLLAEVFSADVIAVW